MSEDARPQPMFPLGTVLFPGGTLPLHIFEPRYRAMVRDCLERDRSFGVVLIARGSEVGGGDQRFGTGTLAEVEQASELPDGRWVLLARGRERIRVETWLPEAPYPLALVEPRPSEGTLPEDALEEARRAVRRAAALASEFGAPAGEPPAPGESPDAERALWLLCDAAPLGSLDRQRLLEIDGLAERAARLGRLATEAGDDLSALLGERRAP